MMIKRQIKLIAMILLLICIPLFLFAFYSYRNIADQTYERNINDRSLYLLQNKNTVERLLNSVSSSAESFLQSSSTQEAMLKSMDGSDYLLYFDLRKELLRLQPFDANNADACLINYKEKWLINNTGLYSFNTIDDLNQYNNYFLAKCVSGWQTYFSSDEQSKANSYDSFFSHDAAHLIKTAPIGKQMNLAGVLLVKIPFDYLGQILQTENQINGFSIFDSNGHLILSGTENTITSQYAKLLQEQNMQQTENDVYHYKKDQIDILCTTSRYSGWMYVLDVSDILHYSGYTVLLPTFIGICMMIFAFSVIGAIYLSKRTYQPINEIIDALNSDNYQKKNDPFSYIEDEIDIIRQKYQTTLNEMSKQEQPMREYISRAVLQRNIDMESINKHRYLFSTIPDNEKMVVLVLQPNKDFLARDLQSFGVSMKAMRSTVEEVLRHDCILSPVIIDQKLCVILRVNEAYQFDYISYADSAAKNLQSIINLSDDMTITAAVGKPFYNILDAAVSYQEALDAFSYAIFYPWKNIISYENLSRDCNLYPQQSKKIQEKLLDAVRSIDEENAAKWLDELFLVIFHTDAVSKEWKVILINLLSEIIVLRQELEPDFIIKDQNGISPYDELINLESQDDMKSWLWEKMIMPYIQTANALFNTRQMNLVKQMKEMIENDYTQDLTIETVAAELNYHPAYLRRIFYNVCGKTFSDCLTSRKMEAAMKWLSETDMMVQEIAEKLGYSNSQNFIRYFKAFTGETPGNYRKNKNETRDTK